MAIIVESRKFSIELCRIFNEDPGKVKAITLTANEGDLKRNRMMVDITRYADEDEIKAVKKLIAKEDK